MTGGFAAGAGHDRGTGSPSADLVVVGLGYVGLPLAAAACAAGLRTVGLDVSAEVVAGLGAGRSHVGDVPDATIAEMIAAGFTATTAADVLATADTIVLCVPTGLSEAGEPDLSAVRAAAHTAAPRLRPGALVVLESTSHPGTTEEVVRPILERGSGLRVGEDFHLVYSPERIDPGNERFAMQNTPKIISGCTPLCAKYGVAFYGRFVDSLVISRGTREAEMAKLLENSYRYVNIALVNEVALFCDRMGIDVWDVLHCAGTKPFGFAPFQPGPGVGGHCIPVDPRYLESKARSAGFTFGTLSAARAVNERMPSHVVLRAAELLGGRGRMLSGSRVLLLGVAYKRDVADTRESPAYPITRGLLAQAAEVSYHDPGVAEFRVDGHPIPRTLRLAEALTSADLVILLQDHSCYDLVELSSSGCLLLDTRGKSAGTAVTLL
ncbi:MULTISPECIES: nucleotide sugar dehydrogenase [unclassified Saccharopolyspora]|uniref:nucleotide sugar dehydrogenase n=1 Tax=unclassified Saccharopolyspora TaxID=2646250 RepID=UPI001CD671F0|nr:MULTISPECIES: nucleotide sugar dehydrogenase [unclassified Saccharopolyspora]MCA1187055.1 nucleotide sugar dehydrogenase [Saccharopolyspora sp. 6T]MCA1224844.1 nucleotide sugar dehydrogenase [Saccharopolyspora sp. 6M]MCA1280192.1 nucleotide sugar dehydrogenase [Saccharopolyspora sp. 7B]